MSFEVPPHTRTHTLEILCTELNAVPHAGLGFHFLRIQVRRPRKEVEVHRTATYLSIAFGKMPSSHMET